PALRLDVELLGQDRDEDLHLHVAEAGELLDPSREFGAISRIPPHRPGITFVVADDGLAHRLYPRGHAAGEAVQGWALAKDLDQLGRVDGGDLADVEAAAPLGSLLVMETATIKLTVPASKITASRTITGGQSGRDLTTARIEASVTDTQLGVASADVVPPAYAGGSVSFTCNPCPSSPVAIAQGTVV